MSHLPNSNQMTADFLKHLHFDQLSVIWPHHQAYASDQVTLLALNQEEDSETIKSFLESHDLDFPVALDSGPIGKQFHVESIPLTVIIDQAGKVAFVNVGSGNALEEKLKAAIDQLLAKSQATSDVQDAD